MAKFVEIKAVANNKKGLFEIFLVFYDILKQDWITLKLSDPLHTLATRAARSAASVV